MDAQILRDHKAELRRTLVQRRAQMTAHEMETQSAAIISFAVSLVRGKPADRTTVATYHPQVTEPGGDQLIEALRGEASKLYLPISEPGGHLRWAQYLGPDRIRPGVWGIVEPTGPSYRTSILAECSVIFVPALGVNSAGVRLGRGGGYYDRTLAELGELKPRLAPEVVALLFDGEITDDIPSEPHDMPVDVAITPRGITYFQ